METEASERDVERKDAVEDYYERRRKELEGILVKNLSTEELLLLCGRCYAEYRSAYGTPEESEPPEHVDRKCVVCKVRLPKYPGS